MSRGLDFFYCESLGDYAIETRDAFLKINAKNIATLIDEENEEEYNELAYQYIIKAKKNLFKRKVFMKYKRALLKVSGEALATPNNFGINFDYLLEVCKKIKECSEKGFEIGIVVGGGNFWRGRQNKNMDSVTADHIGMLGTVMNAMALSDAFKQLDVDVRAQSAIKMDEIVEPFCKNRALRHFEKGRILIFGGGTGSPFFSTDSAASLRALEINADVVIKLTNVDGIYDSDPNTNPNAKMYDEISYQEVIEKNLKVMDLTAISLCKENNIPILVMNINKLDKLSEILNGEKCGTLVK